MRRFYLRLTKDDFTTSGNTWTSDVIDLYDNASYTNFSTAKSEYGSGVVGENLWTSVAALGATPMEGEGFAVDHRYIDYTGKINIVNITVPDDELELSGTGSVSTTAEIYTSDVDDAEYPNEWTQYDVDTPYLDFDLENVYRYMKLVVRFSGSSGITVDAANIYVRVEIGPPNINPMFRRTRAMLDNFPAWMAIRELDNEPTTVQLFQDGASPNAVSYSTTPNSLGGEFINSVAGEWLDEINQQVNYLDLQRFIDTVDLTQMAWAYKCTQVPDYVVTVLGDGHRLGHAVTLDEFRGALDFEHVYWWDEETETLYTNREYAELKINGTAYTQEPVHIWNYVDEIGLLVDLRRIYLETNARFRQRILDVHVNKPGVGIENFKNAIRRELDIWRVYGATPDSNYSGATPEILEMSDIEADSDFMDAQGLATERFSHLVHWLSYEYPTTWGRFLFDKAVWDVGGADFSGYGVLPHRLDATPLSEENTQSGIGDGDDLYIYRPEAFSGPHEFNATLKIRGRHKVARTEYREVELPFQVYGTADRKIYNNPTIYPWFTLEVVRMDGATPSSTTYFYSFQMSAKSNIDVNQATNTSTTVFDFLTEGGQTGPDIHWQNKTTGAVYEDGSATPITPLNAMRLEQISTITLKHGQWDVGSQGYINTEASDKFEAYFSHDTSSVLTYNAGTVSMSGGTNSPGSSVVLKSKLSSYTVGTWSSPAIPMTAVINGALPDQSRRDHVIPLPEIPWDNHLESPPNKQIVVELTTRDWNNTYGGITHNADGDQVFLDSSYFYLNESNSWTGSPAYKQTLSATGLNNLTFRTGSGSAYPMTGYSWEYVAYNQTTPVAGIVDANGSYRDNRPPEPGDVDFTFANVDITRNDFGVPNTTDYVMTWMGIESDDPNVIVWLDSNTIEPAVEEPGVTVEYPENAITETLDAGVYEYGLLSLKARLRPDPPPQWNPQIHAGYFYDRQDEYYLYADPITQYFTDHASPTLQTVARQGAPIIVKTNTTPPREMRQVWFFDDTATPVSLSLTGTQLITPATPVNTIYLPYSDVYNVTVTNQSTGVVIPGTYSSSTNQITLPSYLNADDTYEVDYIVNGSFYAKHNVLAGATPTTQLFFDRAPAAYGGTKFGVTYESSIFHPATPTSVELSPLYTTFDEGFIFISHNEYTLDRVEVRVSPSAIVANGTDYLMITLRSLDEYGNPKPHQQFNLSTTWGTVSPSPVTTNKDGIAVSYLTANASTNTLTGILTVTGGVTAHVKFDISPIPEDTYGLYAVPSAEMIPADGVAKTYVFGHVENTSKTPVPYSYVSWARGRSLADLFRSNPLYSGGSGIVLSDASGNFTIGPFTAATPADTGYWFLSAKSSSASPSGTWTEVGDVVFWYEYPINTHGVENLSGLPVQAMQMATPVRHATPLWFSNAKYPVDLSPDANIQAATPPTLYWTPPQWFPISRYYQYQMGLYGATPNRLAYGSFSGLNRWTSEY